MFTLTFAAFLVAASPQAGAPPSPTPSTPAACVAAARELRVTRAKELGPGGMTPEVSRKIEQERQALLKACVAQFDAGTMPAKDLPGLAALYAEANQPEQAKAAVERALAAKDLAPADRAEALVQAVVTGLREPKGDERNARLERLRGRTRPDGGSELLPEVDRPLPHEQLLPSGRHRRGHHQALHLDHRPGGTFRRDAAQEHGSVVVSAFVNLAQARAGQGQNEEALTLLRRALAEWSDVPSARSMVQPEIERYSLVGTAGAPITAPRWLNRAAGHPALDLKGKVTLLSFTAHWCGPCRESYPGINRLRAKYGKDGFQVVLATQLYGFFQAERPLTAEAEVERDEAYFAGHGLDVPIAIGDQVDIRTENGRTVYVPARNPNDAAYKVSGIPQIQLLDRRGRIRLIMIGYDEANEAKLAGAVEELIKEK